MRLLFDRSTLEFRPFVLICAFMISVGVLDQVGAETTLKPSATDRNVTRVLGQLLKRYHISRKPLNDKLSERALELYIDALDPQKQYFYQSDYDEFLKDKWLIDDMVRKGDLSIAYDIYHKFLTRVDERVKVACEILDQPLQFQKHESIIVDPETIDFPKDAAAARDRWRRIIKYSLLDHKDENKKDNDEDKQVKDEDKQEAEGRELLRRRYKRYSRRWREIDRADLLEIFLSSVTKAYDPHTTYFSPSTLGDFEMMMRLNLEGIGAELREKDGYTTVSRVISGGAASKHGKLKQGDHIVSVGQGADGEMADIVEMPLRQVVKLIRGKSGTTVRLGVKPGGVGEVEVYKIVRSRVELEDRAAQGEVLSHQVNGKGPNLKIGYISLPSFYSDMESARRNSLNYRSSTRDVRRILEKFKSQGVECVVLDLSMNGGGSLPEAISLTGLFIDQGPVVQVKQSNGSVETHNDVKAGVAWDGPLVVMTSQFSASASEILAGAIRDYRRGIVVGDPRTHGKGTVQSLRYFSYEFLRIHNPKYGALKVTLQQFYLPDGESTQKRGVPADIVLPSLTAHMDVGEADLEYALEHDRVPKTRHQVYGMVPDTILNSLRVLSAKRVAENQEFMDRQRVINSYLQVKKEKSRSLHEEEFFALRKRLAQQTKAQKELLDPQNPKDEIYHDYFYNNEVLNIASEYTDALRQLNLAQAG